MQHKPNKTRKIKVGISHGDINGIGYEIIIKSLQDTRILDLLSAVVYGSSKIASYHRKTIDNHEFNFNICKNAGTLNPKRPNLINITEQEVKIELGSSTPEAGEIALMSLEAVVEDLKKRAVDVVVTAPINKHNIQSGEFAFPGHTEYFANRFDSKDFLMLMVCKDLRIGTITGHIPINEVSNTITKEGIEQKVRILHKSLVEDFAIRKPKIAVLGLNPHAGDEGLIGKEEQDIIIPAVKQCYDEGMLVYGPFAADGFFGSNAFEKYDGIIAMYHDQAMLPFKSLSFSRGVNYTAGLPIVRTSPAHGTAYEIAGKNQANPDSFREAMYLAIDIFRNRQEHHAINKNPLGFSEPDDSNNHVLFQNGEGKNNGNERS